MHSTIYHTSRVLKRSETYDASKSCPVCLSSEPRPSVALIQKQPAVHLLQCGRCGGCSASHMPHAEVLQSYYESYYDDTQDEKVTVPDVSNFARRILRTVVGVGPVGRTPKRILDFGGGDGSLCVAIARLLDAPVVATLVDYEEPTTVELPGFSIRKVAKLEEVEEPQDVVIASASLEHVPEVHQVMKDLFELMSPEGGVFYARTPYVLPFMKLLRSRVDFTYPAHVHDFGPEFWNGVVDSFALNAEIVASRPSIVETGFRQAFLRTTAAWVLKSPCHLEAKLFGVKKKYFWPFVGGWEIAMKKHGAR